MLSLSYSSLSASWRVGKGALALLALLVACLFVVPDSRAAGMPAPRPLRTVTYRGYRIAVPASWPVFDLRRQPNVCVRFNRHAVYLGAPPAQQQCPSDQVGRTEAILLEPLGAPAPASGGAGTAGEVAIHRRGVLAVATWNHQPQLVRSALGVRALGALHPSAAGERLRIAANRRASARSAGAVYTGVGFDACSAPSSGAMSGWGASSYRAVGIYIGGANMACSQSNLSAAWVAQQAGAGWHFIPTYVGLQAPGNSCGCASISPSRASTQGTDAAIDAVTQASALGLGPGNPIYFDMEAYSRTSSNTTTVLSFLSAWTAQLHRQGYQSGVYSSTGSGIADLAARMGTGYPEPDDIWFAHWNGTETTADGAIPSQDWANHQRVHQYSGDHHETHGGATLDVDSDYVDAATAGPGSASSTTFNDGTFVQVQGSQQLFEVVGGAPLFVSNPAMVGSSPVESITQAQFDGLRDAPADGTFLRTTTGVTYRVAGGAPLLVTNGKALGAPQNPTVVDQWNLDHVGDPMSHLQPLPLNGTFLRTPRGAIYRVAGGAPFRITSWSVFGHARPSVTVNGWDFANLTDPRAHLRARPLDGTVVEGLPSHWYWSFSGGYRQQGNASAGAVTVDDLGVPAFPSLTPLPLPQCHVPRLRGLTLRQVRRRLTRSLCRLGKVTPLGARAATVRRVVKQSPHAGTALPEEHRVAIHLR